MANTVKKLSRAAVATSEGTLYTVPALTTTVVTNIVLTNTTATAITATVKLDTFSVLDTISVAANGVFAFDLRQVIETTATIRAFASATGLNAHISGMEIA
jgi:hypothetical protein